MAKVDAPLLSFNARGQVGKTAVFAQWRGVKYARQRVIPSNPQTSGQSTTRNTFTTVNDMWKVAPALLTAPWNRFAAGQPLLPRNAFLGQNVKANRGNTDFTSFIGSPGASGGLPPDDVTLSSPSTGEVSVSFTTPTAPSGWSLDSAVAVAFPDQDPSNPWEASFTAGEDDQNQSSVSLTGFGGGTDVIVSAWLVWTKPSGRKAYSVSTTQLITTTA